MKTLKQTTNALPVHKHTKSSGFERSFKLWLILAFTGFAIASLLSTRVTQFNASAATFAGFPYSTPITLNNTGTQLWVTNPDPDNNSVTVIDATNDQGNVLREIKVGNEPNSIAINGRTGSHT